MVFIYNFGWFGQLQGCDIMKYKCLKSECPVCQTVGSIQLFLNNKHEVRYARTRHYSYLDKDSAKPQFTYCRIENLSELKTLLSNKPITLSTSTTPGQTGHGLGFESIDPQLGGCATKRQTGHWASSSVRIEHQPPKLGVVGSNPTPPATL